MPKPISIEDGILNYLDTEDDYVENYEEISKTYSQGVSLETQVIINCCQLLVDNFASEQEKKILDIGCGAGFVINSIKCSSRTAVDISLNQLKRVSKDITRIRANVEELPLVDKSFDIVICTDLFEHVLDGVALVREIKRVIKPGGMLLFACPWEQDLSVYEMPEYKERFKQYKYVHVRSVNQCMVDEYFSDFYQVSSTDITVAEGFMELKPYFIKFIQFIKK